jgi:hypothetical protein
MGRASAGSVTIPRSSIGSRTSLCMDLDSHVRPAFPVSDCSELCLLIQLLRRASHAPRLAMRRTCAPSVALDQKNRLNST